MQRLGHLKSSVPSGSDYGDRGHITYVSPISMQKLTELAQGRSLFGVKMFISQAKFDQVGAAEGEKCFSWHGHLRCKWLI